MVVSRHRGWSRAGAVVLVVVGLTAAQGPIAGATALTPATAGSTGAAETLDGDFAGLVEIGGRRLYLECRGRGSPTMVLESGGGDSADV